MQWLMWLVTLATLALLHRVTRNAPVEAQATLALGALLLLAYVSGTIARRLRLPRITGYLVAGWIAGPAALELVSGPVLDALTPFATGTLFLIAFAVGNALSTDFLRTERRATIFRITAGAMVVPFVAVTLVVLTVSPWFPLTAHQRFRDALTVALALGTVSAVSSPAVTWPVITDAGAHGQLPHTTLEVSALQDFLGATLILLVIALAVPLGSRGTVTPGIAVQAVVAITGSIVAGVTLALASTQYLRVIQQGVGWALVVLALVASQIVWLGGLDAVLMGVAGGVALRAIAPEHSARVRATLERCAIAVYVVFFALAGAHLQLDALSEMWSWAVLLIGLRIAGLWGGMRWAAGGRNGHPAVGREWRDYGWLGFVSQGGFAVTLAEVLRRAFPEWNVSLQALVMAMIGVQQLTGPICFEWVLRGGRWDRLSRWGQWARSGGTDRTAADTRKVHDRTTSDATDNAGAPVLSGGSGMR